MTKDASSRPLPKNWASDALSEYLDAAFGNVLATFVNKNSHYATLVTIDRCFSDITESLSNAQKVLAPLFLTRSHSAYRTEVQLAMAGQCAESFCIGRSCLEFALYGLHITEHPDLEVVWLQRHENENSLKRVRKEFSNRSVMRTLETIDTDLYRTVEGLYQRTIDYGGHPNERSIASNISMDRMGEETLVRQFYLQGDSQALMHALKTSAQIGLRALYVFASVFPNKFESPELVAAITNIRDSL